MLSVRILMTDLDYTYTGNFQFMVLPKFGVKSYV